MVLMSEDEGHGPQVPVLASIDLLRLCLRLPHAMLPHESRVCTVLECHDTARLP